MINDTKAVCFRVDLQLDDFSNKEPRNKLKEWLLKKGFTCDWYNYDCYHYAWICIKEKKVYIPNPKIEKNIIFVNETDQALTPDNFIKLYDILIKANPSPSQK